MVSAVPLIRSFLAAEITIFLIAALIHLEIPFTGYRDQAAATAEGVIAALLLIGLLVALFWPDLTRKAGLVVQIFALLGTIVGTILLVAVGPATVLDVTIHLVMLVVLTIGLTVAIRRRLPG